MSGEAFSEFDLIRRMTGKVRIFSEDLRIGIGDDCGVISADPSHDLLLTSDLFVEKVHFDRRWFSLEQIGGKALRASLSDIAAMGGRPGFSLVGFAFPVSLSPKEAETVYGGIRDAAEKFGVTLVGGDLSRTEKEILLDIMLLGKVGKGRAVLRSGARPGDQIFVSGSLGEAFLGLKVLELGLTGPDAEILSRRQRVPEPRIALGQALGEHGFASAMIDVSDGLSSDLGHLCQASGVGARIEMRALPVSEAYRNVCTRLSMDTAAGVLHGGEDYELLFTIPSDRLARFSQHEIPVPVSRIGEIVQDSEGVMVEFSDGRSRALLPQGFNHFLK
jgi:thiamine-monophosphate kinase